jgi:hypothetical protein
LILLICWWKIGMARAEESNLLTLQKDDFYLILRHVMF